MISVIVCELDQFVLCEYGRETFTKSFFQFKNLLDELDRSIVSPAISALSLTQSISTPLQANQPLPQPQLRIKATAGLQPRVSSPPLMIQQMQALAEMQAAMLKISKRLSSEALLPLADDTHQLPDRNEQQMQQHNVREEVLPANMQSSNPTLQQQQNEALAELQELLMRQTSVDIIPQVSRQDPDQQDQQDQQQNYQTPNSTRDATAKLALPATRALQQQQNEALAELQAILSQVPRDSASTVILGVSSPIAIHHDLHTPTSIGTLSVPASVASRHSLLSATLSLPSHLQRAPPDTSDHNTSDSDHDEIERGRDNI